MYPNSCCTSYGYPPQYYYPQPMIQPPVIQPPMIQPYPSVLPNYLPSYYDTEYILQGYLYHTNPQPHSKYQIIPLYGKPYRGGFFKYYIQVTIDHQLMRFTVSKNKLNKDYSREIYDGDIIELDQPVQGKYQFREREFID